MPETLPINIICLKTGCVICFVLNAFRQMGENQVRVSLLMFTKRKKSSSVIVVDFTLKYRIWASAFTLYRFRIFATRENKQWLLRCRTSWAYTENNKTTYLRRSAILVVFRRDFFWLPRFYLELRFHCVHLFVSSHSSTSRPNQFFFLRPDPPGAGGG